MSINFSEAGFHAGQARYLCDAEGWTPMEEQWSAATLVASMPQRWTVTVPSDATLRWQKGDKVKVQGQASNPAVSLLTAPNDFMNAAWTAAIGATKTNSISFSVGAANGELNCTATLAASTSYTLWACVGASATRTSVVFVKTDPAAAITTSALASVGTSPAWFSWTFTSGGAGVYTFALRDTSATGLPITLYASGWSLYPTASPTTTTRYFYVTAVTATTLGLTAGIDYAGSPAPFTGICMSRAENPFNFPDWFNYRVTSSTLGGLAYAITDHRSARFKIQGQQVYWGINVDGTTSGTPYPCIGHLLPVLRAGANYDNIGAGAVVDGGNSLSGFTDGGTVTTTGRTFFYTGANWGTGTFRTLMQQGNYPMA